MRERGRLQAADTDPAVRESRVDDVVATLTRTVPGSRVLRQGSLGAGTSDAYSDIDLAWIVPDAAFDRAIAETATALGRIAPVVEARAKPQLARSRCRRLLFVRFADMPLLWHVDLDVRCASIAGDDSFDDDDPDARSEDGWSRPASALANAIAAVKALKRGRADFALATLSLGFERVGLPPPPAAGRATIVELADACAVRDAGLRSLAGRVHELADEILGRPGCGGPTPPPARPRL